MLEVELDLMPLFSLQPSDSNSCVRDDSSGCELADDPDVVSVMT